jgi:hypothetical protein
MVIHCKADKATIRQETEISVMVIEMRKGVKGDAVHGDKSGGGEQGLFIERDPVKAMVIR